MIWIDDLVHLHKRSWFWWQDFDPLGTLPFPGHYVSELDRWRIVWPVSPAWWNGGGFEVQRSRFLTLQLPIAVALRASAGLPGCPRPGVTSAALRCRIDGGIVSNVAKWVFKDVFRQSIGRDGLAILRDWLLDIEELLDWAAPFTPGLHGDRTWMLCVLLPDPPDTRPRRYDPYDVPAIPASGPTCGPLNIAANIRVEHGGLHHVPLIRSRHPAVRLVFDAMVTASEIGRLFTNPG